jgi:4-diphosphocytidyl-2-C-methyl-D-erythritol kinase
MILYPNAKINIGLNILNKRDDGFHELETFMYPIAMTDILTINKSNTSKEGVQLTTTGINIDGDVNDNLIVKAYEVVKKEYKLPALDIHLHKSIPFGAGLGGGSSDCAFTIKGINSYCNLNMSVREMQDMSAELGSDCSFFIENRPAIAKGRGEILELCDIDLSNYTFVIVIPPIHISTKQAYSLVKPNDNQEKLVDSLSKDISMWKDIVFNGFEESVFSQFTEIDNIKSKLYNLGAVYSSLSGSGSAVFAIFKKKPNLANVYPNNYFVWVS